MFIGIVCLLGILTIFAPVLHYFVSETTNKRINKMFNKIPTDLNTLENIKAYASEALEHDLLENELENLYIEIDQEEVFSSEYNKIGKTIDNHQKRLAVLSNKVWAIIQKGERDLETYEKKYGFCVSMGIEENAINTFYSIGGNDENVSTQLYRAYIAKVITDMAYEALEQYEIAITEGDYTKEQYDALIADGKI